MEKERRRQLEQAVQYAIDSNYEVYDRQIALFKRIKTYSRICIFGAGRFFEEGYPYVKNMLNAQYICDNHIETVIQEKRNTYGLKCISISELEQMKNVLVVIMLGKDYLAVKKQLDEKQIENIYLGDLILNMYTIKHDSLWFSEQKEQILKGLEIFADDISQENYVEIICNRIAPHLCRKTFEKIKTGGEYFQTGVFSYIGQEVYVDIGAYTGDTIEQFCTVMANMGISYKKIYAFELEKKIYEQLKHSIEQLKIQNAEIYNLGIAQEDSEKNSMVRLDTILKDKEISILKMDIEGYEWGALHGGLQCIRTWKPKMAICLYHCLEDLWRIPLFIKEIVPEYQLYLRHHSPVVWDSVLYAECK